MTGMIGGNVRNCVSRGQQVSRDKEGDQERY